MALKEELASKAGSFISKKLTAFTGTLILGPNVIGELVGLGVAPNIATWSVLGVATVYIIIQGIVDFKQGGVKEVILGLRQAGVIKPTQ